MFRWWTQFWQASRQTKYFFIICFLFGLITLVTTIYVYARLDYVRSYKTS